MVLLTGLLDAGRARRGTRRKRRALRTLEQAVLVLRWFLDGTRRAQSIIDGYIERELMPGKHDIGDKPPQSEPRPGLEEPPPNQCEEQL